MLTVSTGYASAGGGGGGGMPAKSKPLTGVNLVVSKTYNALDGINEALGDIAGQLSQIGSNTGVMKESLNGMSRELGSIGENVSFLMAIGGATALIALVVLCLVIGIRRKLSKSTDNIIQSYADQTAQPFQTTSPDQGPAADPANPLTPPTAPAPAGAPAAAPAADPAVMGPAVQIRNGVTALKNRGPDYSQRTVGHDRLSQRHHQGIGRCR